MNVLKKIRSKVSQTQKAQEILKTPESEAPIRTLSSSQDFEDEKIFQSYKNRKSQEQLQGLKLNQQELNESHLVNAHKLDVLRAEVIGEVVSLEIRYKGKQLRASCGLAAFDKTTPQSVSSIYLSSLSYVGDSHIIFTPKRVLKVVEKNKRRIIIQE